MSLFYTFVFPLVIQEDEDYCYLFRHIDKASYIRVKNRICGGGGGARAGGGGGGGAVGAGDMCL